MNTSIEQKLEFSTNWKKYHENGSHKAKPYVIDSGLPETNAYWFPPQTHKASDLKRQYHILYNYLRDLPLDRGLSGDEGSVRTILSDILHHDYWEYNNRSYHYKYYTDKGQTENANKQKARINTLLEKHQAIFGETFTLDILDGFLVELGRLLKKRVI